jgi:hypothetical protein
MASSFSNKTQLARVAAGLTGNAPFFANPKGGAVLKFVEGVPDAARADAKENRPSGNPTAPWGSRHVR